MANDNTKVKKQTKWIKIIFGVVVLLMLANLFAYPVVSAQAKIYLSLKYKDAPSKFELVDHNQAHLRSEEYQVFFMKPVWVDFSFEYKYNDRLFFVNRDKGRFYDDYQLEDIEKWSTEWLQENVDKRIVGIELNSNHIFKYQSKFNNNKINQDETEKFLHNYFSGNLDDLYFACLNNEHQPANDNDNLKINKMIYKKLNLIGINSESYIKSLSNSNYEIEKSKTGYSTWTTYYWF